MRKGEEEAEIKNETVQARNRFSQIVNTPLPARRKRKPAANCSIANHYV